MTTNELIKQPQTISACDSGMRMYQYLWLKVARPMVVETNATAQGKVV